MILMCRRLVHLSCTSANAEAEIPDIDFDRVKEDARKEWAELLGRFGIEMKERASVKMRCCLTRQ